MTTIDPSAIFPNDRVLKAVANGEITQIHRGDRYAEAGDTFELEGVAYEVVEVTERTLGDLTDADARREGSPSLEAYKERMKRVHGGNFEWDPSSTVYRHRVERVE